jgi:tocopherol O-methyltransferase
MSRFTAAQVRDYYDRHTSAFVSLGQGRRVGAIHRAVWAPGVRDEAGAFHYVDDEIVRLAGTLGHGAEPLHVVDLGCGIGASLCYQAQQLPIRGTGITVSPVQARLAAEHIAVSGIADRVVCLEGDYCDLPAAVRSADLAYAIESFVHTPSASRFFDQCRRLVRPGGLLVICDDVRADEAAPNPDDAGHDDRGDGDAAARAVAAFRAGWHVNTLVRSAELRAMAAAADFDHVATTDLTPYLQLGRWRDRAIGVMLGAMRLLRLNMRRVDDLAGGHALQQCLRRGWIRYELAVFRRLR